MSRPGNRNDSRTVSEDRSRNWANNVIEKSTGGRSRKDSEPKLNWLVIIGVFIAIIIVIIYFSYRSDGTDETGSALEAVNNPALTEATVPTVDTLV